ncbi:hypothetical protein MH111_14425 [Bacillus altitudinis]|uniref:hypothetical protein n=1 Tax=Bacillus altitudinis TaxID=293387 RepID=UPI00227E73D7|nr:hypothetical protein [Bacillus altitudinis]MCY7691650.1 hypothetical protein [Bacillus altitudinis]
MQLHQYKGAISYGGSVVGGFRVDGAQAFCFQPSIKRLTSAKYKEPTSYDNAAKFLIDDEEKKKLNRALKEAIRWQRTILSLSANQTWLH